MGPSPANHASDDRGAATRTGGISLSEHAQPVLVLAFTALDVFVRAEGRSATYDRLAEHLADGSMQADDLLFRQRVRSPLGMDAREKKRLVDVYIAQTRHDLLSE